ncbi:MAG: hypothetical protein HYW45_02645 [Candidatus Daviesbacteria bacterium]|nr:MAG: hypothetical protein HYW45_02645 [Candidatus Daviesbacteria bacterium]
MEVSEEEVELGVGALEEEARVGLEELGVVELAFAGQKYWSLKHLKIYLRILKTSRF